MLEKKRTRSREEAIVQLVNVFRQYGYEGTTLARLSAATGLGKASLYHHFPKGKEEMAAAVLQHINAWCEDNIIASLRSPCEPIDRLRQMSQKVDQLYEHGHQPCLFAVLSLGDSHDLFHAQIRGALNVWIDRSAVVFDCRKIVCSHMDSCSIRSFRYSSASCITSISASANSQRSNPFINHLLPNLPPSTRNTSPPSLSVRPHILRCGPFPRH